MIIKTLTLTLFLCVPTLWASLEAVEHVDIARYLGTWEEIARLPNKYQEGCINSTANYAQAKGYIEVKNSCTTADGKTKDITGRAKIDDPSHPGRLKVNFTPFFIRMFCIGWGNYWIIELDKDYQYAVVIEPNMEYLWILARHKPMNKATYNDLVQRLKAKGFSMDKLIVAPKALSDT